MRQSHQIVFASTNRHKYEEFKALLADHPQIELIPATEMLANADKIGKVETFDTYEGNAAAKARVSNHGSHFPCLADDTGLEVDVLDKRPGVRSHRYASPKAGLSQDQANREKLLEELRGVPMAKRAARFVTCVALEMEGVLVTARGTLEGRIAESPLGRNGFGYDSIFIPEGSTKTLAEMSDEEKNKLSHRARAVEALMQIVKTKGLVFARP